MSSNTPTRFTIPILEKCCCLQIKSGGIIVACLWLIPLVLATAVTTWEMITTAISRANIASDHANHSEGDVFLNMTEELEMIESWHDSYLAQFAMVQSFSLTLLATCLLHIYGAFKERRLFMVPFITLVGMFSTAVISGELMRIILLTTSWVGFLAAIVFGAIGLYSLLVLISYYLELKEKPSSAKEDDVIEAIEDALW